MNQIDIKISMDEILAYQKIFEYLKSEDDNLRDLKSGIFFAPEIYIAFQIGKLSKINEQELFGQKINWHREYDLKNGGPSDIIFQKGNQDMIVFELKICNTYHSYIKDLEKLKRIDCLSNENVRSNFFIALIDVFEDCLPGDRVDKISEYNNVEPVVTEFKRFKTTYSKYKRAVDCVLGMWKVS